MNNLELVSKTVRTDGGLVAVTCDLTLDDGQIVHRTISLEDYITMLQGATRRTVATMTRVGSVPDGFVDGYLTNEGGTMGAAIKVPSKKHQFVLNYNGKRKAYFIPMPNLFYVCTSVQGSKRKFDCFTYQEWNGDETVLCHYPYANVSSTGSICMGSCSSVSLRKLSDFSELIETSLCGETNSDYTAGKVRLACETMDQFDFCDSIEKEDTFPHHLLLPQSNLTVGKVISELMNGVD